MAEDQERLRDQDPFDASRLDQDSLGTPGMAIAKEMGRISDLAPRAVQQLEITVSRLPSPAATRRERAAYDLEVAYQIESIAQAMVVGLRRAPAMPMTLGEYLFFIDFFHVPLSSSVQDILEGAAKREQYMRDLREANDQHRSLRVYYEAKAEDERLAKAKALLARYFEAEGPSSGNSSNEND